jgi:protein-S-isoprenylcysteine O-methyltransferase Ste14
MSEEISRVKLYARLMLTIAAFGVTLFLSAGTVYWIEGWIFAIILSVYIVYSTLWSMKNTPELLRERLRIRKTQKWDKIILSLFAVCFVALFVMPGLDFRAQWTPLEVPIVVEVLAFVGVSISFILIFLVTKENAYASKAIKIQENKGHTVVTTGPYTYVRHPLYAGGMILLVCMPLTLGSLYSLIPGALCAVLFIVRTYLEDIMLHEKLPGYREYAQKTRYRLVPGVW